MKSIINVNFFENDDLDKKVLEQRKLKYCKEFSQIINVVLTNINLYGYNDIKAKKIRSYRKNIPNLIDHKQMFEIFGCIGLNTLISLKSKDNCKNLEKIIISNSVNFNHKDFYESIKQDSLKVSEKEWLSSLFYIKNLILVTQPYEVIEFFYEDFLKTLQPKTEKGYFYQKILEMAQLNKKLLDFFIKQKKYLIPVFREVLKGGDSYPKILTENILYLLSYDNDYKKIAPEIPDVHFLFQDDNKIIESEIWKLSYITTTRAFNLKVNPKNITYGYNTLIYAIVEVLKNYGINIYVILPFSGNSNKMPFMIALEKGKIKDIDHESVKDFFDYLSLKVNGETSIIKNMDNYVNFNASYINTNKDLMNILNIELEYFILNLKTLNNSTIKSKIIKQ